jgi:hypothetical protein
MDEGDYQQQITTQREYFHAGLGCKNVCHDPNKKGIAAAIPLQ